MEIVLNLNSVGNSLDLIKYCTLYFDKLKIDSPITIDSVEKFLIHQIAKVNILQELISLHILVIR